LKPAAPDDNLDERGASRSGRVRKVPVLAYITAGRNPIPIERPTNSVSIEDLEIPAGNTASRKVSREPRGDQCTAVHLHVLEMLIEHRLVLFLEPDGSFVGEHVPYAGERVEKHATARDTRKLTRSGYANYRVPRSRSNWSRVIGTSRSRTGRHLRMKLGGNRDFTREPRKCARPLLSTKFTKRHILSRLTRRRARRKSRRRTSRTESWMAYSEGVRDRTRPPISRDDAAGKPYRWLPRAKHTGFSHEAPRNTPDDLHWDRR
jgi:hypothetical protein